MTRKKFIIIAIVVLLAIFTGLVIYNLFFKEDTPLVFDSGLSSPEEFTANSLEPRPDAKFVRLTQEPIMNFKLVNESIFFVASNGSIKEMDLMGVPIKDIGNFTLDNVLGAKVGPLGTKAALLVSENSTQKERWLLFDNKSTRLRALASNTNWVSFSPQEEVLIGRINDGKTSLFLRNNEGEKVIFTSNIPDLIATWLDNETIALSTKPSGLAPGILYFSNKKGVLNLVIGARNGLTTLVSKQKNRVLFSQTSKSGKNLLLKVLDIEKGKERLLSAVSLPEKCTFGQDSRFVYCATFTQNPNTFIMPDDYYKGIFSDSVNDFVKINLETGNIETVSRALRVDAVKLELSDDESRLFFINKKDGNLYRLKLN